ncbi:Target SNARE coiled-coil domain protein [Kalmanozyma brasiliensis GHG001]|uniref:t-SNARE coiled-coil homology domain-containing protein n=1 Tax=Kalmanozyma brasiliensis (strain GHG001) TaxID=1365824 RepID=V5GPI6_KALBG|nr:Target SNARE coiled-coil domain protein [Kalmanozyma brasiliensis GHG001]EST07877.1 Target SNARE coiled-coil domain protein [Kalmanozyma brasiliensis GHG001]
MSSPAPLPLDHNPFADEPERADHTTDSGALHGAARKNGNGGFSDAEIAGLQEQHWQDQDRHLDALSGSLNRQHEMSLQMNEELDLHQELLEEYDHHANRTGLRLGGATSQMDRLRDSLKDHGMVWMLGALIVALILLIAFFK